MLRFRPQAVKAYNSPDGVGGLLQFPAPSGLRLLGVLAVVLALFVVAAYRAEVPVIASGPGLIQREAGVFPVVVPTRGKVVEIIVAAGGRVEHGELMFVFRDAEGDHEIKAPRAALVDHVAVAPSQVVDAGHLMAELVPDTGFVGYLALDAEYHNAVEPGDEVELRVRERGAGSRRVVARVRRVRESLLTVHRAQELLGRAPPTDTSFVLELDIDDPGLVHHGLPFTGEVVIQRERALWLVLPFLAGG